MGHLDMLDFDMTRPPGRTYRYFQHEPLFPFGHGLNPLTRFSLQSEFVAQGNEDDSTFISVVVTNLGTRRGDEVIMLYFQPEKNTFSEDEPASLLNKQLFGFQRVSDVEPGQSIELSFVVNKK